MLLVILSCYTASMAEFLTRASDKATQLSLGGEDLFPHTHVCKAGLPGMRFKEDGRDLVESEEVVKRSSTHMPHATKDRHLSLATKDKHLSSVYTTPASSGLP